MIIEFDQPINFSVQVGDLAWYIPTNPQGVPGNTYSTGQTNDPMFGAQLMGEITEINRTTLPYHIDVPGIVNVPFAQDFIMFSKNNKANLTSILGYYANITMINHSKEKIELFSVASEISQSSK
tara:strand:- start:5324 stop:5695 length:372 start_codon:yes stop_codon:yes gene_type:complete